MQEKITYKISTPLSPEDCKNPLECAVEEEFQGERKLLVRIRCEKVPKKPVYVIIGQDPNPLYGQKILDCCSHTNSASEKVLEHALRYVQKRIGNENKPLLVESDIENLTHYDISRFKRVEKRLKRKV